MLLNCIHRRTFPLVVFGLLAPLCLLAQEGLPPATDASDPSLAREDVEQGSVGQGRVEPRTADPSQLQDSEHYVRLDPETEEFKQAIASFRNLLKQLLEYEIQFHNSENPAQLQQNRDQWYALREQAFDLHRTMLHAGLAEYVSAPENKINHAHFLFASLNRNVENDCYEGMLPIAKALFETGYPAAELPILYIRCCLAESEFELARQPLDVLVTNPNASEDLLKLGSELERLASAWQQELEWRQRDAEGPPLPQVRVETTKGNFIIELFENDAPIAVANFISLVERGFYSDKTFFLVLDHMLAQTGCPKGDGTGGPGYFIPREAEDKNRRSIFRGSVALNLLPGLPDSGGSQFFISFLPDTAMLEQCTVFGRVISGMPNASRLNRIDPQAKKDETEKPIEPDEILSIQVLRKRDHAYAPVRLTQPTQP